MLLTLEDRINNFKNNRMQEDDNPLAGPFEQEPEPALNQASMNSFDDIQSLKREQQEAEAARAKQAEADAKKMDIFQNAINERAMMSRYVSNLADTTAGNSQQRFAAPGGYLSSGANIQTEGKFNLATGKRGTKAWRNNNPGNITGMGGRTLFGAIGVAKSPHGDSGDRAQQVFDSPEAGTKAMLQQMSAPSYNKAPIASAFDKWQTDKKAWNRMKNQYRTVGIDVDNQRFNDLTPKQKYTFMNIRAKHEGWNGNIPNVVD